MVIYIYVIRNQLVLIKINKFVDVDAPINPTDSCITNHGLQALLYHQEVLC